MTHLWRAVISVLLPCALAGCIPLAEAELSSNMVLGRGIVDIPVSAVTGRDCSAKRLDQGLPYCAPRESLPAPPPFCTKTLGSITCWKDPDTFVTLPHQVADSPALTPEQTHLATARWPKSINLFGD